MKSEDQKQQELQARAEIYDKLTPAQKLAKLNVKLGNGVGAKKQRAKLLAQIEQQQSENRTVKHKNTLPKSR